MTIFTFFKARSRLFTGQKSYRCTNYGDPHIFPFVGEMQTCGLCGTHTLVKNDWVIVSAKVDFVNSTISKATYISKVKSLIINFYLIKDDSLVFKWWPEGNLNCCIKNRIFFTKIFKIVPSHRPYR